MAQSQGPITASLISFDLAGVDVDPPSLTVIEGSTGTIAVMLESEPTDDVTVTLSTDSTDFAVTGGNPSGVLTFSSSTWDTAQDITVTPADDVDGAHESGSIKIEVASTNDAKYNAVTHDEHRRDDN